MTHHSEPAREAVTRSIHLNAITALPDEVWGLLNKLPPEDLRVIFARLAAGALSASPAPAAGGLEAVDLLRELHSLIIGECPSLLNEDSGGNADLAMRIEDALASPAATSAETQGGDGVREAWSFLQDRLLEFEAEIGSGDEEREWAGHVRPALARFNMTIAAALAPSTSAATSAETQGGDGVREANVIPIKMADGKGGWTIDPETLEAIADKVNSDGWDCGQWEGIQGVLLAVGAQAFAPSTSAATRGEPVAWVQPGYLSMLQKCGSCSMRAEPIEAMDYIVPIYGAPPAPAVESAQVKDEPQLSERDQQIVREWLLATHSHRGGSRLGRLIAQRIADDLEADGVTEADIDRLFPRASLDLATDAEG